LFFTLLIAFPSGPLLQHVLGRRDSTHNGWLSRFLAVDAWPPVLITRRATFGHLNIPEPRILNVRCHASLLKNGFSRFD
jgi:hypothetical protein